MGLSTLLPADSRLSNGRETSDRQA